MANVGFGHMTFTTKQLPRTATRPIQRTYSSLQKTIVYNNSKLPTQQECFHLWCVTTIIIMMYVLYQ